MIVDLAVVIEDQAPVRREHRLVARGREVDDGQAAVRQADAALAVDPNAFVVGAPMFDCVRHAPEQRGLRRARATRCRQFHTFAHPLVRNGRLVKRAMTASAA